MRERGVIKVVLRVQIPTLCVVITPLRCYSDVNIKTNEATLCTRCAALPYSAMCLYIDSTLCHRENTFAGNLLSYDGRTCVDGATDKISQATNFINSRRGLFIRNSDRLHGDISDTAAYKRESYTGIRMYRCTLTAGFQIVSMY